MPEITITDTNRRPATDQILDVREDFEITEGMIPGAIHIPMGELNTRLDEIDINRPIVVVCRSGNRSARVAEALTGAGFTADTMAGGMTAWQRAGLPVD
ncbi:rhodanese-like domain-containing protein [Glutamicibacter sp. JL.03c]|uniref:rhodanese-like domain-containing protein n=1 Tax=Glutamicibacter sp. JL.03c TaxID=2984842 RepID=UPI0021F731C5|nr:rhodanese-like domain-containing protein [Glutamicibacter sp. JL.03c]UYQ77348.1 rhodanese-like domain-containing protein [Glutamicibacter sp. JL.03c]